MGAREISEKLHGDDFTVGKDSYVYIGCWCQNLSVVKAFYDTDCEKVTIKSTQPSQYYRNKDLSNFISFAKRKAEINQEVIENAEKLQEIIKN